MKFPTTHLTAIMASRSKYVEERKEGYDKIVEIYWNPVFMLIRHRWSLSREDAQDLTQAFFVHALTRGFFRTYSPEKGTFRTFIRTCVMRFVINESRYAQREKRGGASEHVSLELAGEPEDAGLEEFFQKEWIRGLFTLAMQDLLRLCEDTSKTICFDLFDCYDLDQSKTSYAELASEFGISVTEVTNHLAWARRQFRKFVLMRIREVTSDDAEFRRETRLVLGRAQ
jgi:RNA polymerase sigma factor (sigma-70 family)